MVGCRFSNPVGVEKATQNTATRAALVPSHRAPIDPVGGGDGELAVPQNLQISDVGWAWSVKWDASDHGKSYQLFQYRPQTQSWEQLTETRATAFQVPKANAPRMLSVRVRAVTATGATSDFSNQVTAGDGNSGGIRNFTVDDPQ